MIRTPLRACVLLIVLLVVPATANAADTTGVQVVQSANSSWGGAMIRAAAGGYRLFSQLLHQDISKTGALDADGKLAVVVSDPLKP